ncbi:hypothetical protein A6035_12705 [Dietzia lutea]|uniref:EamA domain-containing protein n=1 Tax=Dietzia lutea TaxID=546160 RepID=A0A2S1R9C8_9ACTN|nr:hypothetical protein A6035_12705 [Dietzia lutea]
MAWAAAFVVCWSSGFVGAAFVEELPSAGLLAWRYLITAALFLALFGVLRPRLSRLEVGQQSVLGILGHVLFLGGVFAAAAAGANAGVTALICALQPMVVACAGRVVWKDTFRPIQVVGLVLGLVAVALSVGGSSVDGGAANLLAVVSLLGLSANALLERAWRPRTPVVTALGVQIIASAGVFTVVAIALGDIMIPVDGRVAGAMAWLVLLSGVGGYASYIVCLRRLGASPTSALLYLTPPVTTVWAWAMFAQRPGLGELVGLAVGAVAVILVLAPRASGTGAAQARAEQTGADRIGSARIAEWSQMPAPGGAGPGKRERL